MIRILVTDDHPLLRSGLRQVLEREMDFAPPGEANSAEEALACLSTGHWDALVLDISLPGRNGLELLAEIRRRNVTLPVLILSVYGDQQFAIRALRTGANGYLTKTDAPLELVRALRAILAGRRYLSQSMMEVLADALDANSVKPPHEDLSDREFQVMHRIAAGRTVSEIADEIALSVKTVSTYRARALDKMRMRTNAEFTRYAVEHRLLL